MQGKYVGAKFEEFKAIPSNVTRRTEAFLIEQIQGFPAGWAKLNLSPQGWKVTVCLGQHPPRKENGEGL